MNTTTQLIKDIRLDYSHAWPNEDMQTRMHRLRILRRIVEHQLTETELKKFIPFDKSHCIRMALLDLFRSKKDSCVNFDEKLISGDLIALKIAIKDWISDKSVIYVGESGTLFRFFQFAIWKYKLDKVLEVRGTLANRAITRDINIVNLSQEELLKLDNGTSQWASAAALLGDTHRVENPPYKLALTYKCLDEWKPDWKPIIDETIYNQAIYFYNLMRGCPTEFIPKQSEDYCFAYIFNKITKDEGKRKWPSLQSHESNRILEMDLNILKMEWGEKLPTKDHRVIHAIAMWAMINNRKVEFEYPQSAFKSWPFFWSFLEQF